ncbi:ATP-binding protein [Streptomyces sp. DSM 44917]|uniref:ATP-binding protein n=1 Tax=Streptomyces boetiae TaxID=3075541 RepID=A0ABU2L816_9ACTN|nr:ATP-binding protein [Streptomyces sp. DSM 44917]MDT0307438.1 ATP-binding protein [Streptomyces sp. DSM 44917]
MGTEGAPVLDVLGQPQTVPVDLRTLSGTATLGLPPRPESVRRARDFTRATLLGWRLPEQFDSVALVVSELVTNALRHGLARRFPLPAPPVPAVELELMRCSGRLVCAVQDPSVTAPRTPAGPLDEPDDTAESGRGLHLVDSFSDGWGWRPLTGDRGKVVWAVFRTNG